MKSVKKSLAIFAIGVGLATGASAKDPDNWPNCYLVYKQCESGIAWACLQLERYC